MRLLVMIARLLVAGTLLAALLCTASAAQPAASRAATRPGQLVGTVIASDARGRTVDLLTGVGHALRVRRVHMPADARITHRGTACGFTALTSGCIVRVECSGPPSAPTASSVELLDAAPAGKP